MTVKILAHALSIMLQALCLDYKLYFLHSLRRGGATAAYRQGAQQMAIKTHGLWGLGFLWGLYHSHMCPVLTSGSSFGGVLFSHVGAAITDRVS